MVSAQDPKSEYFIFYLSCDISTQVGFTFSSPRHILISQRHASIENATPLDLEL